MLRTLDLSRSALVAQRERMNVIAGNIANAQTTHNAKGEPEAFLLSFEASSLGDEANL